MEETVVFTGVCDSVHRGCVADTRLDRHTPAWADIPRADTHPRADTPLGGHPPPPPEMATAAHGTYPTGMHSFFDHCEDFYRPQQYLRKGNFLHLSVILFTGGGACVAGGCVRVRRDGQCSGRYASYWNAFFLLQFFRFLNTM